MTISMRNVDESSGNDDATVQSNAPSEDNEEVNTEGTDRSQDDDVSVDYVDTEVIYKEN